MREAIVSWVRFLAYFYLLFTVILHLVPGKKYEKYVRFFMGLLLIWMLCAPLFALIGKADDFLGSFAANYQEEKSRMTLEDARRLQILYLKEGAKLWEETWKNDPSGK